MSDRAWKAFERRLARQLGTHRIPVTGERAGADFEDPVFVYQAKKRRTFPGYVAEWLDQTRTTAAARSPEKVGVVILQRPRGRDGDALVIVAFRDWCDLHVGTLGRRSASDEALTASRGDACEHCGAPFTPATRGHGNRRRYCTNRCRILAWAARQPERVA